METWKIPSRGGKQWIALDGGRLNSQSQGRGTADGRERSQGLLVNDNRRNQDRGINKQIRANGCRERSRFISRGPGVAEETTRGSLRAMSAASRLPEQRGRGGPLSESR